MIGAGKRAIRNGVAVDVFVTRKTARLLQLFFGQYLAALQRLFGILERLGHPVVHAQVEIRHDEHRRLHLLRQVEGIARHREALRGRAGEQHGMLGVAVREPGNEADVALRGSRRQSGRRPNALHVPNHSRQLDVVAQVRRTPPSAKFPVQQWPSWSARLPILRPKPCRLQPAHPQLGRWQRSLCHQGQLGIPSCNR